MNEEYIPTNGIRLHVVMEGPADGPLVILLHGFPEFWYGWKKQIPALAAAGYRVWAPDERGYNTSDKPRGVRAYTLDELTLDIAGLIDAAGRDKATVVGHDWGAMVAWQLARKHAARVDRLVIVNVPHPGVFQRYVLTHPGQMVRSLYFLFFQIPRVPEALFAANNWSGAVRIMRRSSRPGTFGEADFERYKQAWSRTGAFTAMLNWYRAAVRIPRLYPVNERITTPTLIIWGAQDVALSRGMAKPSIEQCVNGKLVFFENATHWVQHEEAEAVNRLLLEYLK